MDFEHFLLIFPAGIPYLSAAYGIVRHETGHSVRWRVVDDWSLWFIAQGEMTLDLQNGHSSVLKQGYFYLFPPTLAVNARPMAKPVTLWFCHFDFQRIPSESLPGFRMDCLERGRKILIPSAFSKQAAPRVWRAYREFLALSYDMPAGRWKRDAQGRHPFDLDRIELPWGLSQALVRIIAELGYFALKLNLAEKDTEVLDSPVPSLDLRLANVFSRIHNQPGLAWKTGELAKEIGISVRQLNRLFSARVGKSIKKYISDVRIQHSMHLLKHRCEGQLLSLKEIAAMCGYSSEQHFCSQFKKFTGMTPLRFRTGSNPG